MVNQLIAVGFQKTFVLFEIHFGHHHTLASRKPNLGSGNPETQVGLPGTQVASPGINNNEQLLVNYISN